MLRKFILASLLIFSINSAIAQTMIPKNVKCFPAQKLHEEILNENYKVLRWQVLSDTVKNVIYYSQNDWLVVDYVEFSNAGMMGCIVSNFDQEFKVEGFHPSNK